MKAPTLGWLPDPKDPSIRHQALIDLLHKAKDGKDVLAAREKIPSYWPVKKIIGTQTSTGFWSPNETCYRPKWTSAVGPLALLGEIDAATDSTIGSDGERFRELHQTGTGSFGVMTK